MLRSMADIAQQCSRPKSKLGVIMGFATLLAEFRRKFPRQGSFKFGPDDSIRSAVAAYDVPNDFGVYLISAVSGSRMDLVYVGKAGTVNANGSWKKQGIAKRMTNRQGEVSRSIFFPRLIKERELEGLHFEWFVTFNGETVVLPVLAEAELLQAYFNEHGRLPELNECI